MRFILEHSTLGFDIFSVLALIVLIGVVVFFVVRARRLKSIQNELENRLAETEDRLDANADMKAQNG